MRKNHRLWILMALIVAIIVSISIPVSAYTIGDYWIKPGIPDVNKPDLYPNTPGWQKDNSCAVASTTNMLWASGYRYKPGYSSGSWSWSEATDAFDLYQGILDTADEAGFGCPGTYGWSYTQEVGWMKWYFQNNINEADNLYKRVKYVEPKDENDVETGLTLDDRQHLIDELKRCQYVELGIGEHVWDTVKKRWVIDWYHSVTMVGYFTTDTGATGTILHDSDRTALDTFSDDYYLDGEYDINRWKLSDYSAEVWGYKTLCPIPEPCTMILLGSGLLGLCYRFRKRRSA